MLARYAYPPLSYEPVLSRFQTIPGTIQKAPENINGSSYTWGTNAPGDRDVYVLPKKRANKQNQQCKPMERCTNIHLTFFPFVSRRLKNEKSVACFQGLSFWE